MVWIRYMDKNKKNGVDESCHINKNISNAGKKIVNVKEGNYTDPTGMSP